MKTKFCPKCKQVVIPRRISGKEFSVLCLNCGYSAKFEGKAFVEKEKILAIEQRKEGVVKDKNVFATYKNKCKKCGYGKAQIIDVGAFYSDEDELIMLKCGKCGFSERVGRKTS